MIARAIARFLADRDGATAVEYALVIGFIAMLLFTAVTAIGTELTAVNEDVTAGFNQ